jgi:hypothetical protein
MPRMGDERIRGGGAQTLMSVKPLSRAGETANSHGLPADVGEMADVRGGENRLSRAAEPVDDARALPRWRPRSCA